MAKQDAELARRDERIAEPDTVIAERDQVIILCDETIMALTRRADLLQEQLNFAIARRYAARSEKTSAGQMRLFDEAEALAADAGEGLEVTPAQTVVAAHARKAWGCRKPLPASLPREGDILCQYYRYSSGRSCERW